MGDTKSGRERKGKNKRAQRIAEDVARAMAMNGTDESVEWFEPEEEELEIAADADADDE